MNGRGNPTTPRVQLRKEEGGRTCERINARSDEIVPVFPWARKRQLKGAY